MRDDGDLDQGGSHGNGEKWMDLGCIGHHGGPYHRFANIRFLLYHLKKVLPHSTDFGFGHVTCFGKWNMGGANRVQSEKRL